MTKKKSRTKSAQKVPKAPNLSARNRAIVARLIEEPGISDRELSAELGIDRRAVGRARQQPETVKALDAFYEDIAAALIRLRRKAVRLLNELLDSEDERIQVRAALGLLQLDVQAVARDGDLQVDRSGVIRVVIENRSLLEPVKDEVEPQSKEEAR